MATRRATLKYTDLSKFYADHEEHLSKGFCFLPPGTVRGDLAPEIKLDITVPIVGRVGPVTAQVVQRAPDGSYGLQLPDFETEAGRTIAKLDKSVEAVRKYLRTTGELGGGSSDEVDALRARIEELEAELEAVLAAGSGTPDAMHDDDEESHVAVQHSDPDEPSDLDEASEDHPSVDESLDEPAQEDEPDPAAEPPDPVESEPAEAAKPAAPSRGIRIVDVRGQEPLHQGVTESGGLRLGLMDIAAAGRTGLFTLHQEDGLVRHAYFNAGGPVGWRSTPLQEPEVLGMLLFKAGQITKEQLQQSIEIMQAKGVRQGEAFISMGVMSFSQLIMVLGKQNEFILQKVLKSARGSWTFHELPKLPEAFLPPPVRIGALLFRSMVADAKNLRGQELAVALKEYINHYIQIPTERRALLADLGMNSSEKRLIEIITERTLRMRELFSMSPVSRQNTAAIFYALIQLGMFELGETETHERYLQRVGASIGKKKRQLIQATHFDVLEVHWISLPEEIDAGYRKLKEEYRLEAYKDLPHDLAQTIERINERIETAYALLKDEHRRREYRKTLVEDFMIEQTAELLAKKGEMAIMRKDSQMAASCFAKALELQPRKEEYRTSLQRARAV